MDELFAHEIAAYKRNVEKVHYVRRLHEDRAKAEKLLRDLLKKPSPQVGRARACAVPKGLTHT